MCDIYASTDPSLYDSVARSVRMGGVVTSIRLERRFWQILDQIAADDRKTVPQFLTALYDEVMERRGEVGNFASLLRVVCTVFTERNPSPTPASTGAREASPASPPQS